MQRTIKFIIRHAFWIVALSSVFSLGGAYYAILLYKNLRTDIQELLPSNARSVVDIKKISKRLRSVDNLAILVFSKDSLNSKRFVIDLAEKLNQVPSDIISSINYRIDQEIKFFKDRQLLYLSLPDLLQIERYIRQKIEYEKELYNPLNIFSGVELYEPILNLSKMRKKYENKTSQWTQFQDGFYTNKDQTKRVILVDISSQASNFEGQKKLKAIVENSIDQLKPKSYASDLTIQYTGGVQDSIEEQTALIEDLEISTIAVSILVTLGMIFYYQNLLTTCALILSIFVGTLWTFGISFFLVGYLNANSAFLGSIIIGNGINFGIIYLARYLEERKRGQSAADANITTFTKTMTSTATAALAAGLSYGSLIFTGFRGFKQFGIIGLIGMILCWISAYTFLPALLTLVERLKPLKFKSDQPNQEEVYGSEKPKSFRPKQGFFSWFVGGLVEKFPKVLWGFSVVLTLFSLYAIYKKPFD